MIININHSEIFVFPIFIVKLHTAFEKVKNSSNIFERWGTFANICTIRSTERRCGFEIYSSRALDDWNSQMHMQSGSLNGSFLHGGHRARVLITEHRRIEAEEPSTSSLFVRRLEPWTPWTQKPSFKSESRHFSPWSSSRIVRLGLGEWSTNTRGLFDSWINSWFEFVSLVSVAYVSVCERLFR